MNHDDAIQSRRDARREKATRKPSNVAAKLLLSALAVAAACLTLVGCIWLPSTLDSIWSDE